MGGESIMLKQGSIEEGHYDLISMRTLCRMALCLQLQVAASINQELEVNVVKLCIDELKNYVNSYKGKQFRYHNSSLAWYLFVVKLNMNI